MGVFGAYPNPSAPNAATAGLPRVYPETFGAAADGVTDCTNAFNETAAYAFSSGYDVQLQPGTYKVTGTVFADNGVGTGNTWCPNWYGASAIKTIIYGAGLAAQAGIFQIRGGSGTYVQAGFYDMTFLGDGNLPCGIVNQGKDGVWAYRCRFDSCYSGMRLWNKDSLAFTEFSGADSCWFRGNCTYHLEYMVTGGSPSFRGSGLKNRGLSNIANGGTGVLIGAGAKVYNAPMDHEIASSGTTTFIQNNSTQPVSFSGYINTETSGGVCTLGAGNRIWFPGKENHSGENVVAGTLIQCDDIIFNNDSSPTALGMRKQFTAALTTGANTIGVSGVNGAGVGWSGGPERLVSIELTDGTITSYDVRYVFEIDIDGCITTPRVLKATDTPGYGTVGGSPAITFTVNSGGQLIVTGANLPASGVTAYWEERQISNNRTAFHPQI